MNKTIWIFLLIIVIGVGAFAYSTKHKEDDLPNYEHMADETVMGDEHMTENMTDNMMGDLMAPDEVGGAGSYEAYSPEKIAEASERGSVVLFFRASWCPTCRVLDKDINENLGKIPTDLTILDVNYDQSFDLKKKYGVTYQHTFVQVDKDGNMIKKWSGSPTLESLVSEVK